MRNGSKDIRFFSRLRNFHLNSPYFTRKISILIALGVNERRYQTLIMQRAKIEFTIYLKENSFIYNWDGKNSISTDEADRT